MGFRDLREFIEAVDRYGDLRRVSGADRDLEIGAITEVAAASPNCPVLLFDRIKGCKPGYRIVTNLLHTERRLAITLGEPPDLRGVSLVRKWKEGIGNIAGGLPPVDVHDGPVRENILSGKDIDIMEFPAAKWHELDGGPYFTAGVTVLRDPDRDWVNLGVYRLQVQDRSTLSLWIDPGKHGRLIALKYWTKGESCPVAVSLGHMPALFMAATLAAPAGVSEYDIAGQINGSPVEVLPGELTGLPVPATAEVVFEGEVPPPQVETRVEGPFGEATGYYASQPSAVPVIKVKSIMHRNDPIVQGAPPMKPLPGLWHFPVNFRCATIWSDLEKCGIPDIQGVWEHGYGFLVVSLKQRYPGHAKQAALIARGSRGSYNVRFVVTVDEDIDPYNVMEVMWAISTRCDPEQDIEVLRDCWSTAIDPMISTEQRARNDLTTVKAIINACKPVYRREAFPQVVEVSPQLKLEIVKKWGEFIK